MLADGIPMPWDIERMGPTLYIAYLQHVHNQICTTRESTQAFETWARTLGRVLMGFIQTMADLWERSLMSSSFVPVGG